MPFPSPPVWRGWIFHPLVPNTFNVSIGDVRLVRRSVTVHQQPLDKIRLLESARIKALFGGASPVVRHSGSGDIARHIERNAVEPIINVPEVEGVPKFVCPGS